MSQQTTYALQSSLSHPARLPGVGRGGKCLNWKFKSFEGLLKTLGHADGMAEAVEVACRDFIDAALASGEPATYLHARAVHQGIVVRELDVASIPTQSAMLFILGAYQQFEGYLYNMVEEYASVSGVAQRARCSSRRSRIESEAHMARALLAARILSPRQECLHTSS